MPRSLVNYCDAGIDGHWKPTDQAIFENPRYGSIRHRVVVQDKEPLYDFPHFIEPGGAAMLPLTADGRVGLVRLMRPAMLSATPVGAYPDFLLSDFGREVWEAPRGFAKIGEGRDATARREFEDEVGVPVMEWVHVGQANPNSAMMATPVELYLLTVGDVGEGCRDTKEGIRQFQLFAPDELRGLIEAGQCVCAVTFSLLVHAVMRGRFSWLS